MAINKVVYGNNTLVDLTDATATAADVISGATAYGKDGNKITGSLNINTVYVGSSAPTSSTGINGDIYIQS